MAGGIAHGPPHPGLDGTTNAGSHRKKSGRELIPSQSARPVLPITTREAFLKRTVLNLIDPENQFFLSRLDMDPAIGYTHVCTIAIGWQRTRDKGAILRKS